MIDTHAHIFSEYYVDIDSLINILKNNNILYVLNSATSNNSSLEVLKLSKKYKNFLLPVIGIHPESINDNNLEELETLINNNKIYAIGEIGLDYHWSKENKTKQKELFISQIQLAQKYNLPIIVHSRDSIQDCLDILKRFNVKGIIHCFTGSYEMAKEFIKIGFKLGIGGVLTFKNSNLREVIKKIDINDIFLETDSPYLSPEPKRGKKNDPSNLIYIAKEIAKIKNIELNEVINIITKNTIQFFDI